ncbi:ABC transporter ATP-binding protein [Cyanosarcina cf. burmensis CCALA 770]|nr:ABC transporter ATP-binding protein [Cyanosarcina cf. burmensis CCALA 770]
MQEWKTIRIIFPLLKTHSWAIPIIIILGVLSSLAEGVGISLFIPLLQNFNRENSETDCGNILLCFINNLFISFSPNYRLFLIVLCIFGCILLKVSLAYSSSIIFSWYNSHIGHELRSKIFRQLLRINYSFLETQESGKLINLLATETWQTSKALTVFMNLIISICTISIFVILLLLISWQLTLLAGIVMTLISLAIQLMTRQVGSLGRQAVQVNEVLTNRMWEGLSGMKVIRAFGRENYEQKRFEQASEKVRSTFLKLDILSGAIAPVSEALSASLLLSILVIFLSQGSAGVPIFLTFIFVLYRLQPKVKELDGCRVGLVSLATSVQEVMYFLDSSDKPYIYSGDNPYNGLKQGIFLKAVNFHYHTQENFAIQDISICIPKGKTTALVGPSGAGKSTIIGLICRFYDVTDGDIYVDDRPLKSLNLTDWRNRIAIVSQDIYMFSTTVRDNIAYGRLDATDEEIITAAKLANADEFISQLPLGYQTKVGDRGIRLSGGQRQRIALARAIIRNPEILILDEATNALDSIAESLIQEAIATLSQDRTVIVIAHRFSTIEQADRIVVLEEGRVVEQGNLQFLLQLNGLFAKLYHLQYRTAKA